MPDTDTTLAGEYTLKAGMSLADGSHKQPGDRVVLSHEDAKRFLAEGLVVDPTANPEGDPHDSADHILSKAEFLRWMDCQYPRYVADRQNKRERNRIVEKIQRGEKVTQQDVTAVEKEQASASPDPRDQRIAQLLIQVGDLEARVTEERSTNAQLAEELRAARQKTNEPETPTIAVAGDTPAADPVVETKVVEADGIEKAAVEGDVVSSDGSGQALPPVDDKPKDAAPARTSKAPKANRNPPLA